MNEKLEKNKSLIQIISLMLGIIIVIFSFLYNTIVLEQQLKNNIKSNTDNIEKLESRYDYQIKKIENDKVNNEIFMMMMDRLERIENKLDNLQSK